MSRRGFSLIEVLLAATLSLLVIALLWQAYRTASAQAARLELRLAGLSGSQLLLDRLRHDLAGALFAPGDLRPVVEDARGGKDNRLNLLVYSSYRFFEKPSALYDAGENDSSWIMADRVRYEFDPKTGYLFRVTPTGEERLAFARYANVTFVYRPDGPQGPEAVRINLTLPGTRESVPLDLPMPYRAEYRATGIWPDSYFHMQPRVRERS